MADQKFQINGGFFDSINNDRLYSADDMNRPYKRVITEGIFATPAGTPSTDLQVVSAESGMNIIVKKGEGLLGGKWFESASDLAITVSSNTNIVPRRDSIIIQIDKRQSGRVPNVVYREGTPSSNPQVPAINTVDNVIERRVANIYVAAGANYIGNDAIVDLRGSSECPWITSLIKQVDTSTLYNQYRAAYDAYYQQETEAFNAFMEQLTEQLTVSTNVVTLESHFVSSVDNTKEVPINITGFNKSTDVLMVRVNKLFASEGTDYTISSDSSKITLTKDIKANNNIDFLVLKSMVVGDIATVTQQLNSLNTAIAALNADSGWIDFTLESSAQSFDTTTTPAIRKFGNEVYLRGSIKGFNTLNTTICTLPANMRPVMNHQFTACAIADGSIAATCVFEISTAGTLKLIAKSGTIANTTMLSIATQFVLN